MLKRFLIGLRQGFNQPPFDLARRERAVVENEQILNGYAKP